MKFLKNYWETYLPQYPALTWLGQLLWTSTLSLLTSIFHSPTLSARGVTEEQTLSQQMGQEEQSVLVEWKPTGRPSFQKNMCSHHMFLQHFIQTVPLFQLFSPLLDFAQNTAMFTVISGAIPLLRSQKVRRESRSDTDGVLFPQPLYNFWQFKDTNLFCLFRLLVRYTFTFLLTLLKQPFLCSSNHTSYLWKMVQPRGLTLDHPLEKASEKHAFPTPCRVSPPGRLADTLNSLYLTPNWPTEPASSVVSVLTAWHFPRPLVGKLAEPCTCLSLSSFLVSTL